MRIRDSIVIGNSAPTGADCSFKPTSEGGNVSGESCGLSMPSDTLAFSAGLAALGGSPIPVMEPLPGSPALDHAVGLCPITDARGVARPQGPACDSGAAERVVPSPAAGSASGGGSPPASGQSRPTITNVGETNSVWRRGSHKPRLSRRRPPVGTVFSFTLNTAANVQFEFISQGTGRRVRGRCVAPTGANRHRPSCRRAVSAGTLAVAGHAGANSLAFQGLLSATRRLSPGRYTLLITATNAAGRSVASRLTFRIVR